VYAVVGADHPRTVTFPPTPADIMGAIEPNLDWLIPFVAQCSVPPKLGAQPIPIVLSGPIQPITDFELLVRVANPDLVVIKPPVFFGLADRLNQVSRATIAKDRRWPVGKPHNFAARNAVTDAHWLAFPSVFSFFGTKITFINVI
jgi:hypothetical protein